MDASEKQISETIWNFVDDFLLDNGFFTPKADLENKDAEDLELTVLYLWAAGVAQGGIHLTFMRGESVDLTIHDPLACAAKVVDAVAKQFPDLARRYPITFEVDVPA